MSVLPFQWEKKALQTFPVSNVAGAFSPCRVEPRPVATAAPVSLYLVSTQHPAAADNLSLCLQSWGSIITHKHSPQTRNQQQVKQGKGQRTLSLQSVTPLFSLIDRLDILVTSDL